MKFNQILEELKKLILEQKNYIDENYLNDINFLLKEPEKYKEELEEKYKELKQILLKEDSEVFNNYISKTTTYSEVSYEIEYLIDEFTKQKIQMPEFQRMYVWDKKKVSEFILSILRDIPIPKLYAYSSREDKTNRNIKLIIDGQQRLTSLLMYYYGIFPKYKVRKLNYSENMNEIVRYCNYYYNPEPYTREVYRLYGDNPEKLEELLDEIQNAKNILETKFKLNINVPFEVDIFDNENNKRTLNISFRASKEVNSILSDDDRSTILTKELGFVLVKGENPSEAVDIFRLYNSAGIPLTAQEIRNGIYHKNLLYENINKYNQETGRIPGTKNVKNINWNNLRSKQSGQEDVKQLFKFLSYYHNIKDDLSDIFSEKTCKTILEDKSEEIINNYSDYISKNGSNTALLTAEFESIVNFFKINFGNNKNGKKIKNYICVFIILKYYNILNNPSINCENIKIPDQAFTYEIKDSGLLSCNRLISIKNLLKEIIDKYEQNL